MTEVLSPADIRSLMLDICNLILEHMSQIEATRYEIHMKADGTPVTPSDVFVEQLVFDYVRPRLKGVTFIGEESFHDALIMGNDYVVILDPIDGTANFCSGLKEWGISFGLWKGNNHLGSFVFMPELGIRLFTGDHIVPRTSRLIGVSSVISDAVLKQLASPGEYRITGCAVYNIYNVINGAFCKFINPLGASVWDIWPGIMLAMEHNCTVLLDDEIYSGEILDPRRKYRLEITR